MALPPTPEEAAIIGPLVEHFVANKNLVTIFLKQVLIQFNESENLQKLIHTTRSRIKGETNLRDKLLRKLREKADPAQFDITLDNVFVRINDLAGVRILHLHTSQMAEIDKQIKAIIEEQALDLVEGPIARTWDDEYRSYFASIGIDTQASPSMYTSTHYVVASKSKNTMTCEIQVRTLMEEVWGEVNHSVNYPEENEHLSCTEQIRALARSTSAATRLVDSIFATLADFDAKKV